LERWIHALLKLEIVWEIMYGNLDLLISTNFTLVEKKLKKQKNDGGKAKKRMRVTEVHILLR
jgi:hypothetical protein